jgi:glycosyltransferase involved in cell wall biosynthesis
MLKLKTRTRIRRELSVAEDQTLVLNIGRISREKGIFELLEALSIAIRRNPRISCFIIGAAPAFDESTTVQVEINKNPIFMDKVKLLPACSPDEVWGYLCAADIFAFTSYHEGMPNSLLEAMGMGVPSIAFSIPPVEELESGTGSPLLVPAFDSRQYSEAILRLAASPDDRSRIGEMGRRRVYDRYMVKTNMAVAFERLLELVKKQSRRPTQEIDPGLQVRAPRK